MQLDEIHRCFLLLESDRESEARAEFSAEVIAEAAALLRTHHAMEDTGEWGEWEDGHSAIPTLGQLIGGFELIEFIGEGSSGQVFRALQRDPAREVALKLLWPSPSGTPALGAREGAMLAGLEHSGIARLYEVGSWEHAGGTRAWIAMEFVRRGRPLDALSVGALDTSARVRLLVRVARAVAFANGKGVIHRDLKPGNVLVNSDGHPFVIDFGLARSVDANTDHSVSMLGHRIVGTLAYLAPESVTPGSPPSVRGDVFALGAILYECLAQRRMRQLEGRSIAQALHAVLTEHPPRLASINRELHGDLDRIVAKATATDPMQRYASADALADDLERHLAGEVVLIEQQPRCEQLLRGLKRHWKATAVGAFILLTLIATTVISLRFAHEAEHEARIATLALAARALDAHDQLLMRHALNRLAGDHALEVAVLRRAADLGGTIVAKEDTYALSLAPDRAWIAAAFCIARGGLPGAGLMRVASDAKHNWNIASTDCATNGIAIDPTGRFIAKASTQNVVELLSAIDGRLLWTETGRSGSEGTGVAVGWSADGRLLVAGEELEVRDANHPETVVARFALGISSVRCIAARRDGLVACVGTREARIVDITASRSTLHLEVPAFIQTAAAWTEDESRLLVGGWDSTVRAYSPNSPTPIWTGRVHSDHVWTIARWTDGKMCSAGADGSLVIWDSSDGTAQVVPVSPDVVWGAVTDRESLWTGSLGGLRRQSLATIDGWLGTPSPAAYMAWTKRWTASVDPNGGASLTWNNSSDGATRIGGVTKMGYIAGDLNGRNLGATTLDGDVILYDAQSGREVWRNRDLGRAGHAQGFGGLAGVVIDAASNCVVVASRVRGCVALSLADGSVKWERVLAKECAGVGVHEGGNAIYASDRDGVLVRLDPATGELLATAKRQRSRIGCLCMDSDGGRLLTAGADGTIRVLDPWSLEELLSLQVSRVTIDSLWCDNGVIWSIDRNGVKRWR